MAYVRSTVFPNTCASAGGKEQMPPRTARARRVHFEKIGHSRSGPNYAGWVIGAALLLLVFFAMRTAGANNEAKIKAAAAHADSIRVADSTAKAVAADSVKKVDSTAKANAAAKQQAKPTKHAAKKRR